MLVNETFYSYLHVKSGGVCQKVALCIWQIIELDRLTIENCVRITRLDHGHI